MKCTYVMLYTKKRNSTGKNRDEIYADRWFLSNNQFYKEKINNFMKYIGMIERKIYYLFSNPYKWVGKLSPFVDQCVGLPIFDVLLCNDVNVSITVIDYRRIHTVSEFSFSIIHSGKFLRRTEEIKFISKTLKESCSVYQILRLESTI